MPLAKKSTANRRKEHMLKSTFSGFQRCLAVVACQTGEVPQNSLKIGTYTVQGHPRSSILVRDLQIVFFSFESNLESNRPSDSFSNRIFESNRLYTTQAVT